MSIRAMFIAVMLLCLSMSGCIVQSMKPFYVEEVKVEMPQINGGWKLVTEDGVDVSAKEIKPWVFEEDQITTYDEDGVSSILKIQYFKIEDDVFIDFTAGDADEAPINTWWLLHVTPVHTVCKLEIQKDTLTLTPLSYDWMKDSVSKGAISVPHIKIDDDEHHVFLADSKEWVEFLMKYKDSKDAFSKENLYVLKKVVE